MESTKQGKCIVCLLVTPKEKKQKVTSRWKMERNYNFYVVVREHVIEKLIINQNSRKGTEVSSGSR